MIALDRSDGKQPTGDFTGWLGRDEDSHPEDLSEVMDFSRYDLGTTIRLIVLSGESRRVDVKRGSRKGAIFIRDGEIYRALTNDLEGDEALFEILAWDKTIHSDSREGETAERNVKVPTHVFLNLLEKRK